MILQVEHLCKAYASPDHPAGLNVLNNVDFSLHRGQRMSVMGPSGCGKSTLLSILYGVETPDDGRIIVAGQDLAQLHGHRRIAFRAKTIGMIFQQFHLLPFLTAKENILLPLQLMDQNSRSSLAERLIKDMGLETRKDHFPHQLSRGECQRVAIARALVLQPTLLLADEPTGSLDQATASVILDLLHTTLKDLETALVLVTHDPKMIRICQNHFRFDEGQLVQVNSHP